MPVPHVAQKGTVFPRTRSRFGDCSGCRMSSKLLMRRSRRPRIARVALTVALAAVACDDEKTVAERGESCGWPGPHLECAEGECRSTEEGKSGDPRCVITVIVGVGDACDGAFPADKATLRRCAPQLECDTDPTDHKAKCSRSADAGR